MILMCRCAVNVCPNAAALARLPGFVQVRMKASLNLLDPRPGLLDAQYRLAYVGYGIIGSSPMQATHAARRCYLCSSQPSRGRHPFFVTDLGSLTWRRNPSTATCITCNAFCASLAMGIKGLRSVVKLRPKLWCAGLGGSN